MLFRGRISTRICKFIRLEIRAKIFLFKVLTNILEMYKSCIHGQMAQDIIHKSDRRTSRQITKYI